MIYAGILAAGKGTRMGNTPMPKQFLEIGNTQIIIHTIDQFFVSEKIDKIIVAVPPKWHKHAVDTINKYYNNSDKITVVEGADERNRSIMNVCNYLTSNFKITDKDIIVTHDAVRPFISQQVIDDNLRIIQEKRFAAVDTVIPAIDTIVESSANQEEITSIPPRNTLFQGQTPQTFYIKEFVALYDDLSDDEKASLTDAMKAYVLKGKKVGMSRGSQANFKITTTYDFMLAKTLVEMDEIEFEE
jgi:D-ribitol-5-phosphate cytidylyltransferase